MCFKHIFYYVNSKQGLCSKNLGGVVGGGGGAELRTRGGTPYNGLYGEAPPERGTFFTLQVYKRVEISQV